MINKLYGMLAPGALATENYYRKTTQPEVSFAERHILVPRTAEQTYIQFCADQLCQLATMNVLSTVLQDLDPNNTYARETTHVEEESTEIVGVPAGTVLNIMEPADTYAWVRKQITLSFDGTTTVIYDGTKAVEWGTTGTTVMSVGGVRLSLNGAPAASAFTATVSLVRKPKRSLMQLLTELDALEGLEWSAELEAYKDSTIPATRLTAYVLNALAKI